MPGRGSRRLEEEIKPDISVMPGGGSRRRSGEETKPDVSLMPGAGSRRRSEEETKPDVSLIVFPQESNGLIFRALNIVMHLESQQSIINIVENLECKRNNQQL